MDCNLSQLLLTLGRADRGTDDQAALDRHVAGCAACSALANRMSGFDRAVATAMTAVPVPAGLHDSLLKAANARRGELWRRTVYRTTALAASVLLAIGLVFGGVWRYRPAVDTADLVLSTERDWESREPAVREWLTRQDLPADFPLGMDFDFRHYAFHGKAEVSGRDVPVVVFQNGTEQARIHVVREGQLNTAEIRGFEGSVWKTYVVRHPTAKGVTYVVLYTNGLEPFLRRPLGPAL